MLTISDIKYIALGNELTREEDEVRYFVSKSKGKIVVFQDEDTSYIAFDLWTYLDDNEVQCEFTFCGHDDGDSPSIQRIIYGNGKFYADLGIGFRAYDYQPLLESGTNIKTINGKKVLGSGDLKTTYEISMVMIGGVTGGSSGTSRLSIYPNKIVKPTSAITSDVIIEYGTSPSGNATNMEEYLIEFDYTSGSISFPSTVKWQNETVPTFKSGYTYQISIVNNLACFAEFKTA